MAELGDLAPLGGGLAAGGSKSALPSHPSHTRNRLSRGRGVLFSDILEDHVDVVIESEKGARELAFCLKAGELV